MTRREYGEGSVHQAHEKDCPRKGTCRCKWRGVTEAGWTESGSRRRITVTGSTEAEARRRLRTRKAEIAKGVESATKADARRKTVASWGVDWLALRVNDVRPSTYTSNRTTVRKYVTPTIGRVRLAELTPAHLRQVNAAARRSGAQTADKVHRDLRKMLRDALTEGYAVPSSLFEAARARKDHSGARPQREALPLPQAVAVLGQAALRPDYARWVAGFYQGQRQGESLGLTWDAVDLERGIITLSWQLQPQQYVDPKDKSKGFRLPADYEARHLDGRFHLVRPKTAAGWRVMPMTEDFHAALTAWREVWPENPHGLIWARDNGWPIDKADDAEAFRALQRAAGVSKGDGFYTGHEMRNTCATILTVAGVDPATITAILGHSSWATSLGYVTSQIEHMRAALRSVNAAYQPKELG